VALRPEKASSYLPPILHSHAVDQHFFQLGSEDPDSEEYDQGEKILDGGTYVGEIRSIGIRGLDEVTCQFLKQEYERADGSFIGGKINKGPQGWVFIFTAAFAVCMPWPTEDE